MSKDKKLIVAVVSFIILFFGGIYCAKHFMDYLKYQSIVKEISINNVDLSKVPDGSFTGSFDAIFVGAEVNVEVQNHKIVDIKLMKHKNEKGEGAEVIPGKVVQAQSLQVDAVSGATSSSKVILKATENALISGEKSIEK